MYSAKHLNGNLICVIDTETTGLKAGFHEILQLAILPLGPDLTPSTYFRPFEIKIKPEWPERAEDAAVKVNRGLLQAACIEGIERWTAVEFLESWFNDLRLGFRKQIVPLGANYQFDRDFIREFVGGPESYNQFFRSDYRDVQLAALAINDMCDWHSERIPFPKVNLSYLCSQLGMERINAHDAMGDCLATAEVYRRLMRYHNYWNPLAKPVAGTDDNRDETPASPTDTCEKSPT